MQSTQETIKELDLEKEDSKMKKVIAQMTLMKQIQKKRKENVKLDLALKKLVERRKIIQAALKTQKAAAEKKRGESLRELERQKKLMESRERWISKIRKEEESRERTRSQLPRDKEVLGKADMLDAHRLLVDRSNRRILERIEEIKLAREKEAMVEQEILIKEQQLAIKLLRQMQLQRDYRLQLEAVEKKAKTAPSVAQRLKKVKSSILLKPDDKKQVMSWMDLEKNSAILHKTDKAIAEKLRQEKLDNYEEDYEYDYDDYEDSLEYEEDIDDLLGLTDMENIINSDFSSMIDVEAASSVLDLKLNEEPRLAPASEAQVRTQVKRFPSGRVSTSVSIGLETPRPRIERITSSSGRRRPQSFSSLMMG